MRSLLCTILVTSEGEFHNHQRRLIQPIFHPKDESYGHVIIEYTLKMSKEWQDGEVVEMKNKMMTS